MPLVTVSPGSFQNPDAGQGGNAMTSPTVTGHASSTATGTGGSSETKSCRWFGFVAPGGQIIAITLKADHTSSGSLTGPTPGNEFALEYSLDNGSSWTPAVSRTNFTASQGPTTFSVALSAGQNISQVQVRDHVRGSVADPSDIATATATIANIKLEVKTVDQQPVLIM